MTAIKPGTAVPSLEVMTLDGQTWRLSEQTPKHFTMIVFYRGYHCPICNPYIHGLEKMLGEFESRGVGVIAISSDTRERAQKSKDEWGLRELTIGYGLPLTKAREWGLYISKSVKESEPPEFSEPGLFLVRPDGTFYASLVSSMPFARPAFSDILNAIDFIVKNSYPARGEV